MSDAGAPAEAGESPRPASAKLFLGGLSWDTTEEKLRDHFSKYGSIVEAVVMRDRQTGRPRGFGFVTFTTPAAADAVVDDVHVIDGRQIDAKKSVPQEMKPKARKVFVGGLSPDTTEDQFRAYFSGFGEVVEAQIMQDHMSGRSRGFGFVTFAEDASAESVFAAGTMHDLGGKKVEVKPATPKGSGSLARPPGGGGGGRPGGGGPPGGRGAPPYGGGGGPALFGGQPAPGPYGAFGMYGFPPPGMLPGPGGMGGYGGMGVPYGGMGGGGGGMAAPYMMMGGYPPGQTFGFPVGGGAMGAPFSPSAASGAASPFAQHGGQQHAAAQQQFGAQQQQPPRPVRVMSRNGSRPAAKVDSASSLEHGGAPLPTPQPLPPPQQQQPAPDVGSVQEQLSKASLGE